MTKEELAKLQLTNEREKWERYEASKASTPDAQRQSALRSIKEGFEAKYGQTPPVATDGEPGPLTRQAKELAETLRRLKVTEAARQAHGGDIAEANGIHKLPRHIIGG